MRPVEHTHDAGSATLRMLMNTLAFEGMEAFAGKTWPDTLETIVAAGFDGIQFAAPPASQEIVECRRRGLTVAGSVRINEPGEAAEAARPLADSGMICATVHLGWGLEDDDEAARLIEAVLDVSTTTGFPLYVETHRATLFQDMWRTVQFVRRFPQLRFNGDFSHWYTGQEMVYGGFEKKRAFIEPVLERVRFLHGRIGNPGSIQVDIGNGAGEEKPYVAHFRELWAEAFRGFLNDARRGGFICFAPELLAPRIYYGRVFRNERGDFVEECDRWQQSQVIAKLARECFTRAVELLEQERNAPTGTHRANL